METMRRDAGDMRSWIGHDLIDESGHKIGRIDDVYVDDQSGEPEWVTVTTGLFGTRQSFVPLRGLESDGDHLVSPWDKGTVKDAPNCDADGRIEQGEEDRLYEHYGLGRGTRSRRSPETDRAMAGRKGQQARTGDDDAMTRSEEELSVGTEKKPVAKARLRKWIETEHQTVTVPVRKEKVQLVREPVNEGNVDRAMSGPDLTESEHEVVLDEEQVVVDKKVVPKERVRLDKDVEVEDRRVEADLRKEQVELEGDDRNRRA